MRMDSTASRERSSRLPVLGRGGGGEAEVGGGDAGGVGHEDGSFEGVFELADVAGPGVGEKLLEGSGVEALDLFAVAAGVAGEEVGGEGGDVFAAVAEGGEADFDGVEAEEEVGAEAAFGGLGL